MGEGEAEQFLLHTLAQGALPRHAVLANAEAEGLCETYRGEEGGSVMLRLRERYRNPEAERAGAELIRRASQGGEVVELRHHRWVLETAEQWLLADDWVVHPDDPDTRRYLTEDECVPPEHVDAVLAKMRELGAARGLPPTPGGAG